MSGISMLTALEIFTNPKDLEIIIGQEKEGEKFLVAILRGPGHRFKPMLTSTPFAETPEVAIETIKEILEGVRQSMTSEFENDRSFPSQYLNPDGQAIDQSKVLNTDLIARILNELRQHRTASTCQMFAGTG